IDRLRVPDAELRIRALVMPGQDQMPIERYSPRAEAVCGDLRSLTDCTRFCEAGRGGILFHTAGIIHPRRINEFYDTNLVRTQNLLQAAVAAGVKRAVVVSSNSPFGFNPHVDHLFDEDSSYQPYMNYGRSKMLMEQTVRRFQSEGQI